jgi:hypothetical protein
MVLGLHRLESLRRGQLFVVKERLDCFAILINPLRANEPRLSKTSIDPIGNPSCTVRPTPAGAPLLPGWRRNPFIVERSLHAAKRILSRTA